MIKNDKYYIDKLHDDMDFIEEQMKNQTINTLENNPVLLDSMMFRLIQISENARELTNEYMEEHSDIPWTAIYGLRNRIVHDYGNVDLKVVYETLVNDIPELNKII